MAKIIDITEKLSFDENPKITIKGKNFEVDTSAETVLKIMGMLGDGKGLSAKVIVEIYEMLFSEKDRKEISKLKLKFKDFKIFVEKAIDLVIGEDEEEGEQ